METFYLSETVMVHSKNELLYKSTEGNCRIYEVIFQSGEGIPPHSHPFGEDCAIVLSGFLDYYISNEKTIHASKGDVVFGWRNHIHGYINNSTEPLHLLILVAPSKIGLQYLKDDDLQIIHTSEYKRIMKQSENRIESSSFSSFEKLIVDGTYSEPNYEEGVKVFIDCEGKIVHVFENRHVEITPKTPKRLIKYIVEN
ncbi:cupin [Bacillus manliponensis]|uniref:Cupin n=1 Tax=Bacillus manliponensis TaxID=574376 RepID=A0A073JQ41_9BACI|nr:cupin domain-containing protein [Bacillus manliponensis]KEK17204.1 cupin [Bacillus manliponensis]